MKVALWIFLLLILGCALVFGCGDDDDDASTDPEHSDDDAADDDDADDDAINDDDAVDDDDTDDDDAVFPPTPAYGYYEEWRWDDWASFEPYLSVFAERDLILFLGIRDEDIGDAELLHLLREAESQGVTVRAWILIPIEDGYWAGETNADQYAQACMDAAHWFIDEGLPIDWIVVDMEMNRLEIEAITEDIVNGNWLAALAKFQDNFDLDHYNQAAARFQKLVDDLAAIGFHTMVVAFPLILDDMLDGDPFIQDAMGTPIAPVTWDEVSFMVYSTYYEELTGLDFSPYLVYDYARSTVELFGDAASIALGITEQMDSFETLDAEIAAAKAAGIERIQIFAFAQTHERPDADSWHDTFYTAPITPEPDNATHILRSMVQGLDKLF